MACGCVLACGNGEQAPSKVVFDENVRKTYALVRECRSPGEHSGINAFTVWVNREAETAYQEIWQTPPLIQHLPPGTVVVKEIYNGTTCEPANVDGWAAMRKEQGSDPSHADWHWQEVAVQGRILADGADPACIGCHRGADTGSCAGFGQENGRDYLCTTP